MKYILSCLIFGSCSIAHLEYRRTCVYEKWHYYSHLRDSARRTLATKFELRCDWKAAQAFYLHERLTDRLNKRDAKQIEKENQKKMK